MNNSISEKDMFMLMMENAEKKTAKKPTCKEAFEHRKEFEYVGSGCGYHLYHKIHKDDYNNIYKVLECFGKDY